MKETETWIEHYLNIADEYLKPKVSIIVPPTFLAEIMEAFSKMRVRQNKETEEILK